MNNIIFFDTSALVKLYYPENGSENTANYLENCKKAYISRIAIIELYSTIYRKLRNNEISNSDLEDILSVFKKDIDNNVYEIIEISNITEKAVELIKKYGNKYGIRTLDSIQVSCVLNIKKPIFLTSDIRLVNILKEMKIKYINPE